MITCTHFLRQEIEAGRIYVLHHELYSETIRLPEVKLKNQARGEDPSTLALFAIDKKNELRVVAIQLDYSNGMTHYEFFSA